MDEGHEDKDQRPTTNDGAIMSTAPATERRNVSMKSRGLATVAGILCALVTMVGGAAPARADTTTVVDVNSAKCLAVLGGNMANGTPIVQWDCNGHDDQSWTMDEVNGHLGYFRLRNKANPNKCLGVPGSTVASGVQLVIWDCNGNDDQSWTFVIQPGFAAAIFNLNSDKIIGVRSASQDNGAAVVQWDWQANPDQVWFSR
jgi:hypothetical protein